MAKVVRSEVYFLRYVVCSLCGDFFSTFSLCKYFRTHIMMRRAGSHTVGANEPMWVKIQTPAISTKTSSKDTQNQPNNKIKGRDRVVLIRSIVYRDTRDNYRIMIYLPSHVQTMRFSSSCLKSHSTLSRSHIYVLTYI